MSQFIVSCRHKRLTLTQHLLLYTYVYAMFFCEHYSLETLQHVQSWMHMLKILLYALYLSIVTLYTHICIALRNSWWAEISVFLMVIHDCMSNESTIDKFCAVLFPCIYTNAELFFCRQHGQFHGNWNEFFFIYCRDNNVGF